MAGLADVETEGRTAREVCEIYAAKQPAGVPLERMRAEAWLLPRGREFSYRERPDGLRRMAPKSCFANAQRLIESAAGEGLQYAEGFVYFTDFPILVHHAWCVNAEGEVVDPTLAQAGDGKDRPTPEDTTYFGVVVTDLRGLLRVVVETGTYGLIYKRQGRALIEAESVQQSA